MKKIEKLFTMDNLQLNTASKSLLLVDDDRLILSTLSRGLSRAGYKVSTAESVDEAEAWLKENERPDLVILDLRMPVRSGQELADQLGASQIPFIMMTALSEQDAIKRASASGAMGYLLKPVDVTQLIPAIETAISRAKEIQGLRGTKDQLQSALDDDRSVSVAVGIIMDQHRLGQKDAMELLRNKARSKQLKLVDLASQVISSREFLNIGNRV
jgi:response regulator NasT